jgi:aspartate ammonia-lyase
MIRGYGMTRTEEDFIGKISVPDDAYYGGFAVRASGAFQLSGRRVRLELIHAVAQIKKAAAQANKELGKLDAKTADAIVKAADDVISGLFDDQFILDAYQAGAGTPLHMNTNEVIANRAIEMLGGKKGDYSKIHPNNHVNMSQSSNDVTPTAVRIASLQLAKPLEAEMLALEKELEKKAKHYANLLSCGRTHLQDAVPISYGQIFAAYAASIRRDRRALQRALEDVSELGIGGTAVGTGITAHPKFKEKIVANIKRNTGLDVRVADDSIETTSSMNCFLLLSGALRSYASTLNRIANDLRLLVSGPKTAIAEIILPEIEPGSSIMPGKVNPSVPEAVNQLCFRVFGNDHAIEHGVNGSQLQLNFFTPLIGECLVESFTLLTNGTRMFNVKCVAGLRVDEERVKANLERSFAFATALNPVLGYSAVSKLVAEAYKRGIPLRQLILEKKLLSEKDLDKYLSAEYAAGPK